jgi:methionine-S-sulfoxide reductase
MKLLSILFILNIMNMITDKTQDINTIYFGGGCFWCVEAVFEDVKGVIEVVNGYAGGEIKNPSYREVSSGKTKHAEVCKITYDSNKISLEQLLEIFFLTHDPTTLNRQGNDRGEHYRSIILYNNQLEEEVIREFITYLDNVIFDKTIVTKTKLLRQFYKAEDYHQGYYKLNKDQQYCKVVISPKIMKAREKLNKYYKK